MSRENYPALSDVINLPVQDTPKWQPPLGFDLANETDRSRLQAEATRHPDGMVIDEFEVLLGGLYELRHPDRQQDEAGKAAFLDQRRSDDLYGTVFYLPWLNRFVRYPAHGDLFDLYTFRNANLIRSDERSKLYSGVTVFVAGQSVGSHVEESLVHSGIGSTHITADPDIITPANLNRMHAGYTDIGMYKVDHTARRTSELNPYITQIPLRQAVTRDTIDAVMERDPTVIVDEVDDLAAKALLRLYAKRRGIPLLMATDVGDKSLIDVERYDLKSDTTPFNGRLKAAEYMALLDGSMPQEARRKLTLKLVGLRNVTARMLSSAAQVGRQLGGLPQLETAATAGGALATVAIREILLGRHLPSGRYVSSPKKVLGLRSPDGTLAFPRALREFAKAGGK